MSTKHWWNDTDAEKTLPPFNLSTIFPAWTGLGLKPSLHSERPVTKCLSHGMAHKLLFCPEDSCSIFPEHHILYCLLFTPVPALTKVSVSHEQEQWHNVPFVSRGVSCRFIISGTEGPYTSVSSSPTPLFGSIVFSAAERLTNKRRSNATIVNGSLFYLTTEICHLPLLIHCKCGCSAWVGNVSIISKLTGGDKPPPLHTDYPYASLH
jgi:hypothetical protein